MKVINLTPHAIVVIGDGGQTEIKASGHIARCASQEVLIGDIGGVPVFQSKFGAVSVDDSAGEHPMPEPVEGTILLVSMPVGQALAGTRDDIYGPNTGPGPNGAIREDGKIVGTRSFVKY